MDVPVNKTVTHPLPRPREKAHKNMLAVILSAVVIVLSGDFLSAATVEELAKSEGKVVFYSTLNNEQIKAFTDAFMKKRPYIEISFYRASGDRLLQRIIAEAQAGRHAVDVFSSEGLRMQLVKEKGLTTKFVPNDSHFYSEGFKDADGHWTTLHLLMNSMAYNTRLVPAHEAPRRYEDLLHSKWKGKIGVNPRDPDWYVNLQQRMGKEKAGDFMKGLSAQNPGLHESHNLLTQMLGAGEYHVVSNIYAHAAARAKETGAPVRWIFDEPVITFLHPIALARNAPHPNAGKLFIEFVLSKEGQTVLRNQGRIPARSDVDAKVFDLKKITLFPSDPRLAKEYETALKEMRAIFETR